MTHKPPSQKITACQRKYDKAKKIAEKEIQEREAKEAEQAREKAEKEKREADIAFEMAEAQKRDAAKAQLEMQKWEQRLVDARRRKKPSTSS